MVSGRKAAGDGSERGLRKSPDPTGLAKQKITNERIVLDWLAVFFRWKIV
ncbi:hypothetical protein LEP1GSC199_2990 [Leptospira vanthielii serovar Holland str. Waz Holland = ATCC 700522]|uniref:Uncharacterized protein n=1 Tax=Leptospira vanthielii serovar Holland str. Waz Holland = ATCC 700522 TaxID=1218591 RepID=N1W4P3_9LEPT|nr:hypothetical protein LEP1GSC199_2990 [Leptospira vanthielii serovar Holland str. Waz Holland = ATCC 700522]